MVVMSGEVMVNGEPWECMATLAEQDRVPIVRTRTVSARRRVVRRRVGRVRVSRVHPDGLAERLALSEDKRGGVGL